MQGARGKATCGQQESVAASITLALKRPLIAREGTGTFALGKVSRGQLGSDRSNDSSPGRRRLHIIVSALTSHKRRALFDMRTSSPLHLDHH